MWIYAHQATFQDSFTFQGVGYKERGEGKGCSSYADDFLGVGWSPLLGVILLDLSLSLPKAAITPARKLFHWGDCEGGGFPQIKLRRGETADKGVNP